MCATNFSLHIEQGEFLLVIGKIGFNEKVRQLVLLIFELSQGTFLLRNENSVELEKYTIVYDLLFARTRRIFFRP